MTLFYHESEMMQVRFQMIKAIDVFLADGKKGYTFYQSRRNCEDILQLFCHEVTKERGCDVFLVFSSLLCKIPFLRGLRVKMVIRFLHSGRNAHETCA